MRGVRYDPVRGLLEAQGPLLALIGLIFGLYVYQVIEAPGWYLPFMTVPARVVEAWQHLREGAFDLEDLKALGTMVSCAFLHGSPEHVIYNMLGLWIFGALIAELIGHRWVFAIFFVTAITGSIFHVVLNPQEIAPALGASGAVMGFQGFYLGMAVRWQLPEPHIWPMSQPISQGQLAMAGVVGIVIDFNRIMQHSQERIAFGAHLGGFVGGLVLASLLPLRPRGATVRRH